MELHLVNRVTHRPHLPQLQSSQDVCAKQEVTNYQAHLPETVLLVNKAIIQTLTARHSAQHVLRVNIKKIQGDRHAMLALLTQQVQTKVLGTIAIANAIVVSAGNQTSMPWVSTTHTVLLQLTLIHARSIVQWSGVVISF